ncbi:tape measure protein [Megalodesulfovibrio gigas]|uniref:tape measure protein n=1 Tax=Megalodesulfovibrio gigas TaxID=879 RepID=UPI0003FFB8B4|nr:tape measure protein [Megalodesulfovibrio gigas]
MKVPGGIYIAVKGDTDQLRADLSTMQRMVKESSSKMSDDMNNALTPKQIEEGYRRLTGYMSSLTNTSRATIQGVKAMNVELGDLQHRVGTTADKWAELQNRMLDTRRMKAAEDALNGLKKSLNLSDLEAQKFASSFSGAANGATVFGQQVKAAMAQVSTALAAMAGQATLSQETLQKLQSAGEVRIKTDLAQKALADVAGAADASAAKILYLSRQMEGLQGVFGISGSATAAQKMELAQLAATLGLAEAEVVKLETAMQAVAKKTALEQSIENIGKAANLTAAELESMRAKAGLATTASPTTQNFGTYGPALMGGKTAGQLSGFGGFDDFYGLHAAGMESTLSAAQRSARAFDTSLTTAMDRARERARQFGAALGASADELEELQRMAAQQTELRFKTDALKEFATNANLAQQKIAELERRMGVTTGMVNAPAVVDPSAYVQAKTSATDVAMKNLAILAESANLSKDRIAALQSQASKGVEMKVRAQALQGLVSTLDLSKREIKALEKEFSVSLSTMDRGVKGFTAAFTNIALYGGIYTAVAGVQQLASASVRAAMDMDKLRLTLEGVYGDRAGAEGQYITNFADTYGKGIVETSQAYIKFAAAAEFVGVSTKDIRDIFEATTQAITKVGGSTEDVSGALVALGQMLSKGTVSAEEFRLQFGERIPGAMKMGADALGVTVAQFKELLKSGEVVATDFIPKLATQLEKFGQGWEKAAGSVESNIQRMKNEFALLSEAVMSLDEIESLLSGLTEGLAGIRKVAELHSAMEMLRAAVDDGRMSLKEFSDAGGSAFMSLSSMANVPGFGLIGSSLATLAADADKANAALSRLADEDKKRVDGLVKEYKVLAESHRYIKEHAEAFADASATAKTFADEIDRVLVDLTKLTSKEYVISLRTEFESPFAASLRDLNMTEADLQGMQDTFSRASSRPLTADSKYVLDQRNAMAKSDRETWLKDQYGMGDKGKIDGEVLVGSAVKTLSSSIQSALGKPYDWGGTSMATGFDCSGLVEWGYTGLANSLGNELESFGVKPEEFKKLFAGATSDKIFTNVKEFVGKSYESRAEDFNAAWIKAGTILATDNGKRNYDKGRYGGIDHIAMAVWDEVEQKLKVVEAVGGNIDKVISTDASAWLARQKKKGTGIYAVNPMEKLGMSGESIADYQRFADEARSIQEKLTADNIRLTQGDFAARRREVDDYVAKVRESDGYIMASAEKRQQIEADLATYKAAMLAEITKDEQESAQQTIEAQRRVSEETARLMESLGMSTGNMDLQREGLLAQIQAEAKATEEALKRANLPAEELARLLAELDSATAIKSRDAKMSTSKDFSEWWDLANEGPTSYIDRKRRDEEKQVWSGVADHYIETTQLMSGAREAFYDAVIAKAQASGDAELAAIAQVARESAALERLQTIQKTGTPGEAFLARLSEGLEEFKSEATKAREGAVAFADGLLELKSSAASALGQVAGDWVYGFLTGTATVEDAWAGMLDNMARAFSDWVAKLTTDWTNDILDAGMSFLKGGLGSLLGGGFDSSSIWAGVEGGSFSTAGILASAKGNVFNAPGLSAYSNKIVTKPTLFAFAQGLMGEAGAEAIVPMVGSGVRAVLPGGKEGRVDLTRTASGHLGVQLPAWLGGVYPFAMGGVPGAFGVPGGATAALAPLPALQPVQAGARVAGGDGVAAPVQMTVNIQEAPGTTTRAEQSADGKTLNIIVEAVTQKILADGGRGTGMVAALDARYGRRF